MLLFYPVLQLFLISHLILIANDPIIRIYIYVVCSLIISNEQSFSLCFHQQLIIDPFFAFFLLPFESDMEVLFLLCLRVLQQFLHSIPFKVKEVMLLITLLHYSFMVRLLISQIHSHFNVVLFLQSLQFFLLFLVVIEHLALLLIQVLKLLVFSLSLFLHIRMQRPLEMQLVSFRVMSECITHKC